MTRAEHFGLEPGSMSDYLKHESPADFVVLHSIAISLRRIADALDGTALGVDVSESLAGLTYQQVYKS